MSQSEPHLSSETSESNLSQQGTSAKVNLLNFNREQMQQFFADLGEKKFRAEQALKWIHHYGMDNFDDMTNFSKALRAKLKEVAEIRAPEIEYKEYSKDGTRKWVLRLDNNNCIETVFIPDGRRGTLCVSSQVGCALDCSFCSTGKQGFQRDLGVWEIMGQVWIASRSFGVPENMGKRPITNVVMMGMGEPLLNFDPVVQSVEMMKDDLIYGLSKRRVTISTSGVVPALNRLGDYADVSLAVSLHAPNDELRDELVPINKKYPIKELMAACQKYLDHFGDKRRVTWEYVLLDKVNDKPEHAKQLVKLLKKIPSKINLIPFNPFPHAPYERSSEKRIRAFQKILQDAGFTATVRSTRGDDIDAACGQLVGEVQDRTRRSEEWQKVVVQQASPAS